MELVAKLRYMGRQYASGQAARGGGQQKHYLEEAADEIERLRAALKAAESRADFFLAQCRDAQDALKPYAEACLKMQEKFSKLDATNNADRGHVPKPAPWPPAPLPNAELNGGCLQPSDF